MRGVTQCPKKIYWIFGISTHTPHARRDKIGRYLTALLTISTHTPHARRDQTKTQPKGRKIIFQLTRLMRGVTHPSQMYNKYFPNFNSHASCEA